MAVFVLSRPAFSGDGFGRNPRACGLRLPEYGEFLVPLAAHRIVIIPPHGCPEHLAQPPAVPVRAGEFAEQTRQGLVRYRRQGEYLLHEPLEHPASHSGPGVSAPRYSTAAAVIRSANLSMRYSSIAVRNSAWSISSRCRVRKHAQSQRCRSTIPSFWNCTAAWRIRNMALNVAGGVCMPGARPCVPSFSSNRTNRAFSSRLRPVAGAR